MPDLTPKVLTRTLLLALLGLGMQNTLAADVVITARVENQTIVDTTFPSRHCGSWGNMCKFAKTIDVPFEFSKVVDFASTNDRDKIYVQLPSRQTVRLVNRSTQETAAAKLAFGYVSQKATYETHRVVTASSSLCESPGGMLGGQGYVKFLWFGFYADAQRPCVAAVTRRDALENSVVSELMVSYIADFPAVSTLGPGLWEGDIDYPIGPGNGFDFGNISRMSANSIRFRIELDVKHDMQVEMPASGGRVEVLPPGGWKPWETTNAIPPRLFHDAPLKVWASSPFAVYVTCQYGASSEFCNMVTRPSNDATPVYMALSLPATFNYNGLPVTRLPLGVGIANAKVLTPAGNVSSQPGQVHFDVQHADVKKMLTHFRGADYQGNVTLVFDANP